LAVEKLGKLFEGDLSLSSPILPAGSGGECQQNFNVTLTDGYWSGDPPSVGDADADTSNPFDGGIYADKEAGKSGTSNTLADVAMYYYKRDLAPTLDNKVPTLAGIDENNAQHLVTYTVAFGVSGTLDPTVLPTDSAFAGWPTPTKGTDTTVDDLWHAAVNGRGEFLNAKDPKELGEKLTEAFESIASRTASSSSVALSSGFLNSGSLLFQARFDSSDWSGQLLAYSITDSGPDIGNLSAKPVWDAGCVLTGGACPTDTLRQSYAGQAWDTGREIITYKPSTGKGIAFAWPSSPASPSSTELDVSQTDWLRANKNYVDSYDPNVKAMDASLRETEATGELRLQFLRGRTVASMRARTGTLGDIINSNPVYVAAPTFAYPDSLETKPYSGFASTHANRQAMLYVGANDGMLHAFDATNSNTGGTEMLAYIPGEVYENLWELTSEDYGTDPAHRVFVDASPTAGDVFFGNAWKTVLVGGLGRGGQGFFALDVTNPTAGNFDESKAANLVLWEFTDANDADLGFTYGQPAIVRLANGKWAAVVGNGFNSTAARASTDQHVSTTGNGVVFILDIETGAVIKKFDTGIGTDDDPTTNVAAAKRPNGIRTPSPVDINGDFIVDYIYAPDLFGNVWKLDVRDANANNWKFAYGSPSGVDQDTAKTPFFVARNAAGAYLPITSRVEVGLHPSSPGQMVYFGTGKYIEDSDNSPVNQDTQVFFGVWDRNEASPSAIKRGHLEPQSIIEELPYSGNNADPDDVRRTTSQLFAWYDGAGLPAINLAPTRQLSDPGRLGWFMDLYNTEGGNTNNYGERMVADPVLRDGKIIFVTLLPLEDPCDFGGDSWLMELSAANGSRLDITPFDLNGDGVFDVKDEIPAANNTTEPVGGRKSTVGILPTPGILKDNTYNKAGMGREFKYFSGSSGAIQQVSESRSSEFVGRQSWREIYEH
jgi:type IV pilus assembly protein PilY1